ncbi:response regulator [Aquincola sp. J276]|uniref:response regulator n=1 Tax=Aquincola sp. J276 TaxID=2898432 RepID=UPI0021516D51|nr:response regulator [Aquincola sp. J276]MCR5865750.1 response regulator [Aquincola sp. J276]
MKQPPSAPSNRPAWHQWWRHFRARPPAASTPPDAAAPDHPAAPRVAVQPAEPEAVALRAALAASEAAGRAKSEFLSHLGHEIRTPMSGITGMADLLAATQLDATQRGYVEMMQRSAGSLLTLVDRLLDFTRLEAEPPQLRAEPVALRGLLDAAVAEVWPRAQAKRLLLECLLDPGLPAWVQADPSRVRQVVSHLLENALEFTPVGQVLLAARPAPEGGVLIEVSDTGIGIAPALHASVFTPFVQADASLARRQGGIGLGLAVVHLLVQAMGGQVVLHSEEGHGALFRVHLPLQPLEAPTAPGPLRDAASARRVGVVSDALASQQAWQARLRHLGHEVVSTLTWRELAFEPETLAAQAPHVVLYDEPPGGWPPNGLDDPQPVPWERLMILRSEAAAGGTSFGAFPGTRLQRPVDDAGLARALDATHRGGGGAAAGPAPQAAPPAARGRVLLVEDHEINQVVARSFLEHLGFEVDVASDATGAMSALDARDFAVVVMDCQMPGMDGYELTQRIRAGEAGSRAQRTPIIALTAHATPADRERCLDAGMNDYLAKPVNVQLLGSTLERWLAPTRD